MTSLSDNNLKNDHGMRNSISDSTWSWVAALGILPFLVDITFSQERRALRGSTPLYRVPEMDDRRAQPPVQVRAQRENMASTQILSENRFGTVTRFTSDPNAPMAVGPITSYPVAPPIPFQYGSPPTVAAPFGAASPFAGPPPSMMFSPVPVAPPMFVSPTFGPPEFVASPFFPTPIQPAAGQAVESLRVPKSQSIQGRGSSGTQTFDQTNQQYAAAITNANIVVSVSESFLNRLIARDEVKPDAVRDNILGADVTGRQTTKSRVRLDLQPSTTHGKAAFVLTGETQSLTTGVTPQAMVDTAGRQEFTATKDVLFDGRLISTRHASVFVRARNQTLGAMTPLSGTLFGGIADRIAYRTAERMRPETEAIARNRVAERVYPEFDGEIDKQLTIANQVLEQKAHKRLSAANLLPSSYRVTSTDDRLTYASLISSSQDSQRNETPTTSSLASPAGGLNLSLHEHFFNEIISRTDLKGLRTTDKELQQQLDTFIAMLEGVKSSRPADPEPRGLALPKIELVTDIELDETDPLSVRLESDRLVTTLKAKFKPAGQNLLPPMKVEIPYQAVLEGDTIRLVPGAPRVTAQNKINLDAAPTVAEQAVQKSVASTLQTLEIPRSLPARYWPHAGAPPRVTSIKSANGWCSIAID